MSFHAAKGVAVTGAVALLFFFLLGAASAFAIAPDGGAASEHRANDQVHAGGGAASEHRASASVHDDGNLDEPQPASNADFTGHGANVHGAYDSTRDGSPSENGNGDGAAVGQPCAGCVGKADNKNPPGQFPDGTDANNGYECDGNSGVGRSNPAHTGCVPETPTNPTTTTTTTTTTTMSPTTTTTTTTTTQTPAVSAGTSSPATEVLGVSVTQPPTAAVLSATASAPTLPATGLEVTPLVVGGIALVLLGALVLAGNRRGNNA